MKTEGNFIFIVDGETKTREELEKMDLSNMDCSVDGLSVFYSFPREKHQPLGNDYFRDALNNVILNLTGDVPENLKTTDFTSPLPNFTTPCDYKGHYSEKPEIKNYNSTRHKYNPDSYAPKFSRNIQDTLQRAEEHQAQFGRKETKEAERFNSVTEEKVSERRQNQTITLPRPLNEEWVIKNSNDRELCLVRVAKESVEAERFSSTAFIPGAAELAQKQKLEEVTRLALEELEPQQREGRGIAKTPFKNNVILNGWDLQKEKGDENLTMKTLSEVVEKEILRTSYKEATGVKHHNGKAQLSLLFKQFPKALEAVAKCSEYGHEKYKDTDQDYLNYQRVEGGSKAYADAGLRHRLYKEGTTDIDSQLPHAYHVAWNALAELELILKNS